jgi:activator of HSP90 ATPase
MKKLVSTLVAGSMAFSLTAVTLATEVAVGASAETRVSACASLSGKDKILCLRNAQAAKIEAKMKQRIIKKTTHMEEKMQKMDSRMKGKIIKMEEKMSNRLRKLEIRGNWKKPASSKSSMSSAGSSTSSTASSAAGSSVSSSASSAQ